MRYIKTEHFVRKKTEEVIDNTNVTGVYGMFSRFNLPLFSRDLLPFLPIHLYQMATLWNITFSLAFAVFLRENHHHQLENFFFFFTFNFQNDSIFYPLFITEDDIKVRILLFI